MSDKGIPQHKRIAMGDSSVKGYKKGGTVGSSVPSVSVRTSGKAVNPLTLAKRQNGIPGFKKGGGK